MAFQKEENGFKIKEFEHTTAEQVESAVDEILEARGADDEGNPFNNLNARINYLESEMRRLKPNIVALSKEAYNRLPQTAKKANILYIIIDNEDSLQAINVSGEISPEVIDEINKVGGVIVNGELD